jgi:DNA-binding NtrC family response regulator
MIPREEGHPAPGPGLVETEDRPIRLLAVDDEVDFVEMLVLRLQSENLDADGVHSGQQALEYLEKREMDVVLLDLLMPGLDGLATLKAIKARRPLVEVILLTGHATVDRGLEALKAGAFDFLIKPVKPGELLERIRDAYDRRRVIMRRSTGEPG